MTVSAMLAELLTVMAGINLINSSKQSFQTGTDKVEGINTLTPSSILLSALVCAVSLAFRTIVA